MIINAKPEDFLNQITEFQFVQVSPSRYAYPNKDSGCVLFERGGDWYMVNHSGKYDIPAGNLFNFTKQLHDLNNAAQVFKKIAEVQGLPPDQFYNAVSTGLNHHQRKSHQRIFKPKYEITTTTGGTIPEGEIFSLVDTFAKGNDPKGVLSYLNIYDLRDKANTTQPTKKEYLPAILKGRYEGGTNGQWCKVTAPFLFFDIDVKAPAPEKGRKGENVDLLENTNNEKVFDAVKKYAILTWRSSSGKGIAGVIHAPELKQYAHTTSSEHLAAAKAIFREIEDRIKSDTGISISFDEAQGKFRQIRFLAPQKQPIEINENFVTFHFRRQQQTEKPNTTKDKVLYFNDYVSELNGEIIDNIKQHKKLIIQAPTGGGKTWAFLNIMKRFLKTSDLFVTAGNSGINEFKNVIFAVPTTTIAAQAANDFYKNFDRHIPIVDENFKGVKYGDNVFIATYNSTQKLRELIPDALLIVDESHVLFEAGNYRLEALNDLYHYLGKAARAVLLSATPYKLEDWHYIRCTHKDKSKGQKINISPMFYKSGTAIDLPIPEAKDGIIFIRMNHTENLEALKETLGDSAAIVSSKYGTKYKEDSAVYRCLMTSGTVPKGIKYILTTSLLDVGVSIRQQVDQIIMFSPPTVNEVLQFAARPRKRGKVNDTINLTVYLKEGKDWNEGHFDVDFNGIVEDIRSSYLDECQALNDIIKTRLEKGRNLGVSELNATIKGDRNPIFWNENNTQYEISECRVYRTTVEEWKGKVSWAGFFAVVDARGGENVTVNKPEIMSFIQNDKLAEAQKINRLESKAAKLEAFELFKNSTLLALQTVLKFTRNKALKIAIRKEIKKMPPDHYTAEDIQSFYNVNKKLIDYGFLDKPIKRYLDLMKFDIDSNLMVRIVYENQTTQKFKLVFNRIVLTHLPEAPKIKKQLERIEKLQNLLEANDKKELTVRDMKMALKAAGYNRNSYSSGHLMFLRFLEAFNGKAIYKKSKGRVFCMGERWTKTTVFSAYFAQKKDRQKEDKKTHPNCLTIN